MEHHVTNLDAYFAELRAMDSTTWWVREALLAVKRGHIHPIRARLSDRLYLMRYWLSEPDTLGDEDRWDSSDSLLLHHFLMPDDDDALHDHPWPFATTILCGGYHEALPPEDWMAHPDQLGPPKDARVIPRLRGQTICHEATDLHSVIWIMPGTWTVVRTGPKARTWGFHGPGRNWEHYRSYLGVPPCQDRIHANQSMA